MSSMSDKPHPRYAAEDLRAFARTLLERAGVEVDIAADVATVLLDGDLLGHTTHGLALLAPYLDELAHDRMARAGQPTVLLRRLAAQTWAGKRLPGAWLIDAEGNPTSDPAVLTNEPKGALLPLGGIDAGHKGFALALLIEALTAGLAGHGRADSPAGWGATVFVQVFDPEAFGGLEEFKRQMDFIADAARNAQPRPGGDRVRLPGERGMQRYREQLERGVALYPTILPALKPWAEKYSVAAPAPAS